MPINYGSNHLELFENLELVELFISPATRKKAPTLPKKMVVRAVRNGLSIFYEGTGASR